MMDKKIVLMTLNRLEFCRLNRLCFPIMSSFTYSNKGITNHYFFRISLENLTNNYYLIR